MGASFFRPLPLDALAAEAAPPVVQDWDAGRGRHLLPAASDTRVLLKVSLARALSAPPTLRVGQRNVAGRMNDTAGVSNPSIRPSWSRAGNV